MLAIVKWIEEWEIQNNQRWEILKWKLRRGIRKKLRNLHFLSQASVYGALISVKIIFDLFWAIATGPRLVRHIGPNQIPEEVEAHVIQSQLFPPRF